MSNDLKAGEGDNLKTINNSSIKEVTLATADSDKSKWPYEDASSPVYNYSAASNIFDERTGKVALPLTAEADDGSTIAIVQLARATSMRTYVIDAELVGQWPKVPEALATFTDGEAESESSGSPITFTLLDVQRQPFPPILGNDGTQLLYRLKITYRYAMSRPQRSDETLHINSMPVTVLEEDETTIKLSDVYDSARSFQRS
jgi:hypothetical protein